MTDISGTSLIGSHDVADGAQFRAVNPATGAELDPVFHDAGPAGVVRR